MLKTSLEGGFIDRGSNLGLDSFAAPPASQERGSISEAFPRLVHPSRLSPAARVRIPTVHVVGNKDDAVLVDMSRLMEGVCEGSLVRRVVHGGGHHPPMAKRDVAMLVKAFEWAKREGMKSAVL